MNTQTEKEANVQEHIKAIISELNSMSLDDEAMAKAISNTIQGEHRTLQQSFFRVLKLSISDYGKHSFVDARNEKSREWCNEVAQVETYIPFI